MFSVFILYNKNKVFIFHFYVFVYLDASFIFSYFLFFILFLHFCNLKKNYYYCIFLSLFYLHGTTPAPGAGTFQACNSKFLLQRQKIGKLSSGGLQNRPRHHDPHLALEHFRPGAAHFGTSFLSSRGLQNQPRRD